MPFLDISNPNVDAHMGFSAGPTSSFVENFGAAFDVQRHVQSQVGLEADVEERYAKNGERYRELTGEEPPVFPYSAFAAAARHHLGENAAGFWQRGFFASADTGFADPADRDAFEGLQEHEAKIATLKAEHPDLKSFGDIFDEVRGQAAQMRATEAGVSARRGFAGFTGALLGGTAGAFSPRDPLNLVTLGLGGFGRTIGARILTEGAVQAGISGAGNLAGAAENARLLGQEPESLGSAVMTGFLGGALLRGAGEGARVGAPAAFHAVENKLFPQRAAARAIRDTIEGNLGRPLTALMADSGLGDRQLAEFMRRLPSTSRNRAAAAMLENAAELEALNPYGNSPAGSQKFAREAWQAHDAIEGDTAPPPLRGAVDRATREAAARDLARAENPETFARFDAAQKAHDDLAAQVEELRQQIDNRTMADAVARIDPASGERVRMIETELDGVIPKARRTELLHELNAVVENIGPETIAKAENDFRIGPKKRLKEAVARARTARKELAAVERETARAAADAEARLNVKRRADEEQMRAFALKPENAAAPGEARDRWAAATPAAAKAAADTAKAVSEAREAAGKAILDRAFPSEPSAGAVVEPPRAAGAPRMVDIGLDRLVPDDGKVVVGHNTDGSPVVKTIREVLDDLREDDRLLEAMKVCAI
jgi:hypothetical protein